MDIGTVVHENDNYKVVLGQNPETEKMDYVVINIKTGVEEGRSPVLPQLLVWAEDFNQTLKQFDAEKANIEVASAKDVEEFKPH